MEAVLWPASCVGSAPGVLSHESALALYDLSDANPAKVHITVAPGRRLWRTPPAYMVVHRGELAAGDVRNHEGVPVTTVVRTIRDCAAAHIDPALLRQAIDDGCRTGWLRPVDAEALTQEFTAAGKL